MDTNNITYMDVKLEDLTYFWTKSGVPCFMANRPNIEEEIEFLGFNIYYLICSVAEDRKVETTTYDKGKQLKNVTYVTDLSTKIVKVVNNFVGRSVAEIKDEDLYDFETVRETAEYNLPLIPRDIIDKLDEFFRLVDQQHGTESIVLLTFDPAFEGSSEGWGVLVPEQVNTSVHCKYEADSIVDQKPENVLIVGSVHSHPNMAAYASGTDHADQADFDGVHITYGWQKSVNGGATQYYIEMQIGGSSWKLDPDDVFEPLNIVKQPDPQVVEWTTKVKKVSPPQGGSVTPVAQAHTPQTQPQVETQPSLPQVSTLPGTPSLGDPRLQEYPDPKEDSAYLVIAEVYSTTKGIVECPSCGADINIANNLEHFACQICDMPVCLSSDTYEEVIIKADKYLAQRNLDNNIIYYLWIKDDNDQDLLMRIKDTNYLADSSHVSLLDDKTTVEVLDDYFYEGFDSRSTVCCNIPVENSINCTCPVTVYYDDILKFDSVHPYDLYSRQANCISCEFYYSRACTPYLTAILDFAKSGKPLQEPIQECSNFVEQTSFSYNTYLD